MAIPEKLNDFDLDDMSKVERLKNAYFKKAVDRSKALNANANGVDEEKKENSKRIFKKSLLERLCDAGIVFDPKTNRPRKKPESGVKREGDRNPISLLDMIKTHR